MFQIVKKAGDKLKAFNFLINKYGMKGNLNGTLYIAYILDNFKLEEFRSVMKMYEKTAIHFKVKAVSVEGNIRRTREKIEGFEKKTNGEFLFELKRNYR